jgi:hypothetical protein
MFLTEVVWNRIHVSKVEHEFINHLRPFVEDGKTNGEKELVFIDLKTAKILRRWNDRESAEAWIALMIPYGPESTNIIEE